MSQGFQNGIHLFPQELPVVARIEDQLRDSSFPNYLSSNHVNTFKIHGWGKSQI